MSGVKRHYLSCILAPGATMHNAPGSAAAPRSRVCHRIPNTEYRIPICRRDACLCRARHLRQAGPATVLQKELGCTPMLRQGVSLRSKKTTLWVEKSSYANA
jgi:hypothetical protein